MTSGAPPDESASSPAESRPAMPPRLVAFVYLQDVPTYLHGPTVFLPGTANAVSHEAILEENGAVKTGALQRRGPEWMATVKAGGVWSSQRPVHVQCPELCRRLPSHHCALP